MLVDFYTTELQVAVGMTARMGGAAAVTGACRHGAQVLIVVEAYDPIVTWTTYTDGILLSLCSCSGVLGGGRSSFTGMAMEYAAMQAALGRSCSCRHATALLRAYEALAQSAGSVTLADFFTTFPTLLGPLDREDSDSAPVSTITYDVMKAGRRQNVPIYVVFYDGTWTAVVIRPSSNKFKLATCCQLSCKSRPWGCIHAKAVNKLTRVDAASEAVRAEMAREDALPLGPDGVLNEQEAAKAASAETRRPGAATAAAAPPKPPQPRRARNMFPCSTEVALCDAYSAAVDQLRQEQRLRRLDHIHVEPSCLICGAPARGCLVKSWSADLYTMRGLLEVVVGSWMCSNGHLVEYDGAQDGLFLASPEIVYTRVFLDSVMGVCVIARSTMAAAAEYLTSVLRNTGAYRDGENGQARQQVSSAVGEFSETLVIPDVAFTCKDCGEDEAKGGRFNCVLGDGQILAVLQQYIMPMLRPGMDAPRADMAITYACGVRNATVRAVIRHRVRSGAMDSVAVTAEEVIKFRPFAAMMGGVPPAPPPAPTEESRGVRSVVDQEKALLWAASTLFHKFFIVRNLHSTTAVTATDAARDTDGGALLDSSEEGSVVDLLSAGRGADNSGNSAGSASEYSSGDLEQSAGDSGSGVEIDVDAQQMDLGLEALMIDVATGSAASSTTPPQAGDGSEGFIPASSSADGAEAESGDADGVANEAGSADDAGAKVGAHDDSGGEAGVADEDLSGSAGAANDVSSGEVGAADETDKVESCMATVPRTVDRWVVPLASVEDAGVETESDDPVAVDATDPASPLTQFALRATNEAAKKPRTLSLFPIVMVGKIPIVHSTIRRLLPYNWLDDEAINGQVTLMQARNDHTVAANPSAPKHYYFNSFFYTKLRHAGEYSYHVVQRWSRSVDVLAMDKIFMPVNITQTHWILVVVEKGPGTVRVYDSFAAEYPVVTESIERWLVDEANFYGSETQRWTVEHPKCRLQENCDDCGVFTIKNMDYISRGLDVNTMTRSTAYYRRRIAAELLATSIGGTG